MPARPDSLDIADVCHVLRERYGLALTYKQLYCRVVCGAIPAARAANRRWQIDPALSLIHI